MGDYFLTPCKSDTFILPLYLIAWLTIDQGSPTPRGLISMQVCGLLGTQPSEAPLSSASCCPVPSPPLSWQVSSASCLFPTPIQAQWVSEESSPELRFRFPLPPRKVGNRCYRLLENIFLLDF